MKASTEWLAASSASFSAGSGVGGYAQLRHYTAAYREWGEGPPLVLAPGLAGGFELLGPLARRLASRYRVICYQLRGEDDCFALRRPFGLRDLVADLAEFLDWRRLERPALLGVSFGGVLALELAARHPGRLGSLIVQGAGARFERTLLERIAGEVLAGIPLPHNNPFINQFFNLLFGGRQRKGPLLEFVVRQCWRTDQSVMAHRLAMLDEFDLGERMERVDAPTLVLAGEKDLLVSEGSLNALCDGLPRAERVMLPGCGHLAFVAQPDAVADAVCRFLARVGQAATV